VGYWIQYIPVDSSIASSVMPVWCGQCNIDVKKVDPKNKIDCLQHHNKLTTF